ncbi:hypothetical protein EBB59_12065 [Lysobacter pythonis]|uniref:X-Tfes XVIPCD domain-containing protein n=1 Tax=Solilutibacter pythonis TaxID=2483112 RepID=A0A3M2HMG0_9GAMM|nr:XVIPCD domain-containing protein [Lysobacter pythonis]RMH88102.1 hypothetical protein EBB59_12065 [Lysobacter pythonis]
MSRPLTSHDYAALAYDSYTDRVADPQKEIDIEGRDYRILATASHLNGYQGTLYHDVESNTVVVAHRGSELDTSLKFAQDWGFTNAQMVLRRVNPQIASADALTREALEWSKRLAGPDGQPATVTTTGHSMGGTHTQVMAYRYGLYGETFNAFGANSLALRVPADPQANVINHVRATDMVSALSHHYGEVRGYAIRKDVQDLLADGEDPRIQGVAGFLHDAKQVGLAPHDIQQFYRQNPVSGAPLLSQENAARFEQNRGMFQAFRHDLYQTRAMLGNGMDLKREFENAMEHRLPGDPARLPKPPQEWDAGFPELFKREAMRYHLRQRESLELLIDGIRSTPGRVMDWGGEKMQQLEENVRRELGVPLSSLDTPQAAPPPPRLDDPGHPRHAMYLGALAGMLEIDEKHQRAPDGRTLQAAAALATAATANGLKQIDHILLSRDGTNLIAMEGEPGNPTRRMATLPTLAALDQPMDESLAQIAQSERAQASQQLAEQQNQQQQQQQRGLVMG